MKFIYKRMSHVFGIVLLIAVLLFLPLSMEIVLVINLSVLLLFGAMKLRLTFRRAGTAAPLRQTQEPFVSIHIPICREPAALVCATIKAANASNYKNFEIIVLSNNTPDASLWEPVKNYCDSLGSQVRFVNIKSVENYKAGALNFCRKLTSPLAKYILTVDADYQLETEGVKNAVSNMISRNTAVIQFPQAYRNTSEETIGLKEEFGHYFKAMSLGADEAQVALPTGTLTLVSIAALDAIGGWPGNSITEDASLGLKFFKSGFRSTYIHQVIGRGLMPATVADFQIQRSRWIFGNFQVFMQMLQSSRGLQLQQLWKIATQLTAWINFLALPYIALILLSFTNFVHPEFNSGMVIELALTSIAIHFSVQFLVLLKSSNFHIANTVAAFLTNTSTVELGAFRWVEYFFNKKKPFLRTDKFDNTSILRSQNLIFPSLIGIAGIFQIAASNEFVGSLILLNALFILSAIFMTSNQLATITTTDTDAITPKTSIPTL